MTPRRALVHASKGHSPVLRAILHSVPHLCYRSHVNLSTVLNKYTSLLILLDFELVFGGVEQVHNLFVVYFDVGTFDSELESLVKGLYFLKQPLHHTWNQPLQFEVVVVGSLPNTLSTYIVQVFPPPV